MLNFSDIVPVNVKIYLENNTPYLDYVGKSVTPDGTTFQIHIPKIGLTMEKIETFQAFEDYSCVQNAFNASFRIFPVDDEYFELKTIERTMTQEQLEKELGYKVNIIGGKERN